MKKLFITLCAFLICGFTITANAADLQKELKKYVTAVDNCVKAYKDAGSSADNSTYNMYLKEARGYRDSLKDRQNEMTSQQLELYKTTTEKLATVDPQTQKKLQTLIPQAAVKPEVNPGVKPEVNPAVKPGVNPAGKPSIQTVDKKVEKNTLQKELKQFETAVNNCVKAYKDSLVRDNSADKNVNNFNALLVDARNKRDALDIKQGEMNSAQLDLFKKLKIELAKVDTIKKEQKE